MNGTILDEIVRRRRERIASAKSGVEIGAMQQRAALYRAERPSSRLYTALSEQSRANVIAEFKKASPSKGVISGYANPAEFASAYQRGGATAISVLTEEDFFQGSLDDLRLVRAAVDLPVLQKDFVMDEFQVIEAALAGADAVLLIAAVLADEELNRLSAGAASLGLDAIVEVHDEIEMGRAVELGAKIIGVNNRNLKTFEVDLQTSRDLVRRKPNDALMVAESGISRFSEIVELRSLGFDGFLIGESLMRSADPSVALQKLLGTAPVRAETS
jgi:indole-3-glycerol phosphate synthase